MTQIIGRTGDVFVSRPIILDYVTPRTGDMNKVFVYDYVRDMNVLASNQDLEFIGGGEADCLAQTETRVARESDDDEYRACELETKTEVTRERDEEEISFTELTTKTAESRERDDEDVFSLLELISKTFADRERDDEDDYYLD